MLKEHKQRLMKLISEAGISSSHFEVVDKGLDYTIRLKHSPIVFILKQQPNSFDEFSINYTLYEPNFPLKDNFVQNVYNINGGIDGEFKYWLNAVAKRFILEKELPEPNFGASAILTIQLLQRAVSVMVFATSLTVIIALFLNSPGGQLTTLQVFATQRAATSNVEAWQTQQANFLATKTPSLNMAPTTTSNSQISTPQPTLSIDEPPEVTAARISTAGVIIAAAFSLVASVIGAYALMRSTMITAQLKETKARKN